MITSAIANQNPISNTAMTNFKVLIQIPVKTVERLTLLLTPMGVGTDSNPTKQNILSSPHFHFTKLLVAVLTFCNFTLKTALTLQRTVFAGQV